MLPAPEKGGAGTTRAIPTGKPEREETALYQRLKSLRKSLADSQGVPPYVIFPDKSLREMATTRPRDREHFANISGVGMFKLEKYGPVFIGEIRKESRVFPE
jgi:ATP-dependent DNA helicase RecQ